MLCDAITGFHFRQRTTVASLIFFSVSFWFSAAVGPALLFQILAVTSTVPFFSTVGDFMRWGCIGTLLNLKSVSLPGRSAAERIASWERRGVERRWPLVGLAEKAGLSTYCFTPTDIYAWHIQTAMEQTRPALTQSCTSSSKAQHAHSYWDTPSQKPTQKQQNTHTTVIKRIFACKPTNTLMCKHTSCIQTLKSLRIHAYKHTCIQRLLGTPYHILYTDIRTCGCLYMFKEMLTHTQKSHECICSWTHLQEPMNVCMWLHRNNCIALSISAPLPYC